MREFTTCFSGLRDCLPLHLSWVQYFVLFGPSAWFPFKFCLYYFFKIKFGLWSVADNGFSITAYQLCKPPQAGSLRRLLGVGGLKLTRLLRLLRLLLLANHFFFQGKFSSSDGSSTGEARKAGLRSRKCGSSTQVADTGQTLHLRFTFIIDMAHLHSRITCSK